jgi:hypothetical protein
VRTGSGTDACLISAPVNVFELLNAVVEKGGDAKSKYGFKPGYLCTIHLTWQQQCPLEKNHVN